MKIIALNKLYYTETPIELACELFYVCELGKCLSLIKNNEYRLSIKGIKIEEQIRKTPFWNYFCFAVQNGWLVDAEDYVSKENAAEVRLDGSIQNISLYKVVSPSKKEAEKDGYLPITYTGKSDNEVFFYDKDNMSMLMRHIEKQTWVTILAYFAVNKYFVEQKTLSYKVNFLLSEETIQRSKALSYLMLLYEKSGVHCWTNIIKVTSTLNKQGGENKLSYAMQPIEETENDISDLSYEAWLQEGEDRGIAEKYRKHEADVNWVLNEKHKVIKEANIEVGDVVALYKRLKQKKTGKNRNSIVSMDFAVVRGIDNTTITFEVIHNKKNILDMKYDMATLTPEQRTMFSDSYLRKTTSMTTMKLLNVGINKEIYNEEYFIATMDNIEDTVQYHVHTNEGLRVIDTTTQQHYVYLILEDYNIDFNKEKYVKAYL